MKGLCCFRAAYRRLSGALCGASPPEERLKGDDEVIDSRIRPAASPAPRGLALPRQAL